MLTDTGACIRETEKIMKKTATIVKMTRPVKNGMYTDKYTVTYESGVTRTFKIVGGMIKVHLDFMMSADVEVIRTASGKHTCDVFTPSVGVDIRYKNCLITGSDKIRYVCVDWSGHYSPKSYATIDEAKAAIDEMIEAVEAAKKVETAEQLETNESEVNEMNNEMYLNNEYRAEYYDEDLNIWVQLDDLTHMTALSELHAIECAVEYLANADYENGDCEDIDESKAKWYCVEWRAAKEINPEYNAYSPEYKWKYE